MRIMLPPDRRRRGLVPKEAEGQCGAGACGTVGCCCEREGQTHLWEAPAGGWLCPCYHGATQPELTTELRIRAGQMVGPLSHARCRPQTPRDSQASHEELQQAYSQASGSRNAR